MKHSLANESAHEAVRPSKKSRTQSLDIEDDALWKASKSERKIKQKQSQGDEGGGSTPHTSAEELEAAKHRKKAEKRAKKEEKRARKEKQGKRKTTASKENCPDTGLPGGADLKRTTVTTCNAGGMSYTQTLSLSNVSQTIIDDFVRSNEIALNDPKEAASLRPVIDFIHLPATNLLEKKPSPFSGFKAPTPIQAASWPFTLSGRDVIGVAETGSGKTMAFALPCVEAVNKKGKKGVRAVIVSPTRELAMQTQEQMNRLAKLVGLRCVCIFGGASKDEQRSLLERGADIIVATPGRLRDFMSENTIRLDKATFAVLDEADRMLDKGFEEDIKEILNACPLREDRQTLMFTATWPQSVQALASTFMVDPVKITIGSGGREMASGAIELQANARITQKVEVVEPRDKEFRLLQILKQHQQGKQKNDRILVFCLYKKEATRVEGFLQRKGVRVGGIHGDLRQEQRTRSLEAFKRGDTPVLVATDVAARGLDIPEVKLVVNCTFPLTIEDYVHRIGRTGRAGKTGEAITLFTQQDKAHSGSLINILRGASQTVPDDLLKFGTTVKKKQHDMYGSFFKDVDMTQKATKITFD